MNAPVTLLPDAGLETCQTDETDNEGFLKIVFADIAEGARPVLVGFKGHPNGVPKWQWSGSPWVEGKSEFQPYRNNYFSLSAYHPNAEGRHRRQKKYFAGLHAVMLDDIGEKVDREQLTLPSSWLLETSPGNFQAGLLLAEPVTDSGIADGLMRAIIDAGLCDPGANGPTARLARLPVGVNGKHDPVFACALREWQPEVRYSVEELVKGLDLALDLSAPRRKRGKRREPKQQSIAVEEQVFTPKPQDNPVIEALHRAGLYKSALGDGKHDITCPWVSEHTNEEDGGTAYFEPDEQHAIGGFKCFHGHCADRRIHDLLKVLEVAPSMAYMKPNIRVVGGEIHRVVEAAEALLAETGRYFQRGGLVVAVHTDPGTGRTLIREMKQPGLVPVLSRLARWERFDGRAEDWVRIDPPTRHVMTLVDGGSFQHLPALEGLAHQPYLRGDGSLVRVPGYDEESRLFGVFDGEAFDVPDAPTRDDALRGLDVIMEVLGEFEFAEDRDRSATVAAILTAVVRPALAAAFMFHVRAHMPGSGKSYLCQLITAFATPRRGTPTTFPKDDEECRKLLIAELAEGPAVIEFDNMTGDLLAHKSLCTVLTAENYAGRLLGTSKTITVGTRCLFLSSGNNVGPVQDMTRRCITILLAPRCENPATRDFENTNPVGDVLADRGRYVSAALTIIRAWIAAGSPRTDCKPVAGFEGWSDWCRQPLLWLGLEDPALSIFDSIQDDPDRDLLDRLLSAWFATFQDRPTMVREAINATEPGYNAHGELREVLEDIAAERGEINRKRLGRWINRHAGRIVNGRRFTSLNGSSSSKRWQVESVSSVCEVSAPANDKSVTSADDYRRASDGE